MTILKDGQQKLLLKTAKAQTGALSQPRGVGWGGRVQSEGTHVHPWLVHAEVWQKTTKFCKAIILQLKNT